ncbi:hypothetical protein SCLCIDRAFT_26000 [Scleroderma citrinum Foug A]|uniref:Uncharacterized protein n=1 Tax=Scleroderma citrinum Foug A TaxID=1036808 RepID=A0A0C3A8J7_9AGAM|nr:hypothetical protein SCLCIDRAFT_26000 [Scleroderma citrinum Foug A]
MSHLASKRIQRLKHSSSYDFPHISRRPQPRRITSELSLRNDVAEILRQNLQYTTIFKEHVVAIRGHPERPAACEHLLKKRGAPHPQHLVGYAEQQKLRVEMEEIIQHRATTVDEHLIICCTVNTLLLLQKEIVNTLPEHKRLEIRRRMNLASRRCQPAKHTKPSSRFGPLVPSSEPVLKRPKDFHECNITESMDSLLDLSSLPKPPKVIGVQFLQKDIDILFCINAVHMGSDGLYFSIKYEDIKIPDVVGLDKLKRMLRNSKRVL